MDPYSSDTFSWRRASADLEGFARSLGINPTAEQGWSAASHPTEHQPHQNPEQEPSYDSDTLYAQASAAPQYPQQGEFFDRYAHVGSLYQNPLDEASASAEHYSSEQAGHSVGPDHSYAPSGSPYYHQSLGTLAAADPSAYPQYTHVVGPDDRYTPSGLSHSIPPHRPPDGNQSFTSHQSGYIDDPYNHYPATGFSYPLPPGEASGLAQLPESQQYDHNFASFYPTADQEFPTPSQMTAARPSIWDQPEVNEPGSSPASSRGNETSSFAQPSQFQSFDQNHILALQDSLALPFPRFRPPNFDDSMLSDAFNAFCNKNFDTVLRIARLGDSDRILDTYEMSMIFDEKSERTLSQAIHRLSLFVDENHIGKLYRPTPQNSHRFIKGSNFYYINIVCEAYSQMSKDFGRNDIPLRFVQVFAHLYGKMKISRTNLASKVGLQLHTMSYRIRDCNKFLREQNIPLEIKNIHKLYCLVLDESSHVPEAVEAIS